MSDGLNVPESVEKNDLARLVGGRKMFRVFEGPGFRGKGSSPALQINDSPYTLLTGDDMHRATCVDKHDSILPPALAAWRSTRSGHLRAAELKREAKMILRLMAAAASAGAACYASWIAVTWLRFGRRKQPSDDPLLDRFIPVYEVSERHAIRVAAPAEITFQAAAASDMSDSAIIRAILRARELFFGTDTGGKPLPRGLLAQSKALGWGVLAEIPGREIVMGAVTKPWEANVVFRAMPPAEFAQFQEPDFVKIVWTLRADPDTGAESVARTETRVASTSESARRRFRRYWSEVSPGILLIRLAILRIVKREAERMASRQQARINVVPNTGDAVALTHDRRPPVGYQ